METKVAVEDVKNRLSAFSVGGQGKYLCSCLVVRKSEDVFNAMYRDRNLDDTAQVLADFYNC